MSTLDPADYKNGVKVSLVEGETVTSDSPKVTLGPAKAIIATVAAALVAGLGALSTALTDEIVTPSEWVTIALATIVGSGIAGAATYFTPTKITGN